MKSPLTVQMSRILLVCMANGFFAYASQTVGTAPTPILVELFTSEGCSSCPPADALVQQLDASQPISGAQLVVLSEHVDYFNHEGWTDPYSSSFVTARQNAYIRALGLNAAYTPQIVVDGTEVMRLDSSQQISQVLEKAVTTPKIPIRIGSVAIDANDPHILRAHIEIAESSEKHPPAVYLAVTLDHADSHVLHGENEGKSLTHVAVLQSLTKIGSLQKGVEFAEDTQVTLKPGADPRTIRIVVFLQQGSSGRVLGAAMAKVAR